LLPPGSLVADQIRVVHLKTRSRRVDGRTDRARTSDLSLTEADLAGHPGGDGDPDPSSAGIAETAPRAGGGTSVLRLGNTVMILDLHRQGLAAR